jgi:16S rRNA processing protein RimM
MPAGADNGAEQDRRIVVGRISGVYGILGWVKVFSYTRPKENILDYSPWQIRTAAGWRVLRLGQGRRHGKGLIARLEGINDRDGARGLAGADIAVSRSQLPPPEEGEYYWCDLIGLTALNRAGRELGRVVEIQETGANDVLVIEGEGRHLVPLLRDKFVREVDLEGGRIIVDWDPDWS